MFGLFKKTKKSEILTISNADFVDVVLGMVSVGEPGSSIMCVVAYKNLTIIRSVYLDHAKKNPDAKLPTDLDSFIQDLENKKYNDDEVTQRRVTWFYIASLIMRANSFAHESKDIENNVAQIWINLAEGCSKIHGALKHNILWSDDEKAWFTSIKTEQEGIAECLNYVMPKWLQEHPIVEQFAEQHGLSKIGGTFMKF
jgi:hypothetical protein